MSPSTSNSIFVLFGPVIYGRLPALQMKLKPSCITLLPTEKTAGVSSRIRASALPSDPILVVATRSTSIGPLAVYNVIISLAQTRLVDRLSTS